MGTCPGPCIISGVFQPLYAPPTASHPAAPGYPNGTLLGLLHV